LEKYVRDKTHKIRKGSTNEKSGNIKIDIILQK